MTDLNRRIKVVVISGKEKLYYANFQIIENLSMVELSDGNLYTVLKDSRGFYIPSSGSTGVRYVKNLVESGTEVYYVS